MGRTGLYSYTKIFLYLLILSLNVCLFGTCKTAGNNNQIKSVDTNYRTGRSSANEKHSGMMLFDFTTLFSLNTWKESSDTVREVGMSKASFVLQKTEKYQRAIFFALLNPQSNGACFAGFRSHTDFDSSSYTSVQLRLRGAQGDLWRYKILLTNQIQTNCPKISFPMVNYE